MKWINTKVKRCPTKGCAGPLGHYGRCLDKHGNPVSPMRKNTEGKRGG